MYLTICDKIKFKKKKKIFFQILHKINILRIIWNNILQKSESGGIEMKCR